MITLIAESKTMSAGGRQISLPVVVSCPLFNEEAKNLAATFATMPPEEIGERVGISFPLAVKARRMFYDFQAEDTVCAALTTFSGEVFRALDISSLTPEELDFACLRLRIVSSLYGLLRPADTIFPYRFDFNVENPLTGTSMHKYWKPKLTVAFVKMLKDSGEREVLDLLPAEASKCLDWKLIKNFARVMKVNFKTFADNGELKTPHTGKIKELRGKLLREILVNKTDSLAGLLRLDTSFLSLDPDLSKKDYPTFISY